MYVMDIMVEKSNSGTCKSTQCQNPITRTVVLATKDHEVAFVNFICTPCAELIEKDRLQTQERL
jgi:hypothetical protein